MEKQDIRTFGRIHGKRLSARQQYLIDNLLPTLIPLFKDNSEKILEIGFGAGEHLLKLASENPDKIIIGAEPFINGVASLLSKITDNNNNINSEFNNIRIWPDDVRKLINNNDFKFQQIWILHPDPWPKARHEKRRLLSSAFLNLLSARLESNGKIIIGTDHYEYYDWIIEQLQQTKLSIIDDCLPIIKTRYQQKNKAGTIVPKYLILSL
ncbi:MAG: tRNA (guanine(46)-N(7))-methyltransferase TrmB [Alphaproteobacteria bacterium]|jgi:tRNA (guanine-N7-)-methyltransferase|nr:tRNA (guanosine(46)-N7)-methyltransferase TrmB [Alphaproteobacteria bacterium]